MCLCLLVGSQATLGGEGRRGMKVNPKGEGAAETGTPLEQVVNALETATGLDLDGDVSASNAAVMVCAPARWCNGVVFCAGAGRRGEAKL